MSKEDSSMTLNSHVLSQVLRVIDDEVAVAPVHRDFWNELCVTYGILAAVRHPDGLELLRRPSSETDEVRCTIVTASELAAEWVEFVCESGASGRRYQLDLDSSSKPNDEPI